MVIPIGGGGGFDMPADSMIAPRAVKEKYASVWWFTVWFLVAVTICRIAALDVFGGFNTGIMAFVAYYLVRDDCQNMSQCCVLYFGAMCGFNAIFELLPLFANLGGRTVQRQSKMPSESGNTVYQVVVEKHPFFDPDGDFYYNFQSGMMIVAPLAMLLGAIVGYVTYQQYATSLFDNEEGGRGGTRPIAGGFGGGYGGNAGASGGGNTLGAQAAQGRRTDRVPLFEGQGQRLGSA